MLVIEGVGMLCKGVLFLVFRLVLLFSLKVRVNSVFLRVLSWKCFIKVDKLKLWNIFLVLVLIDLVIFFVWLKFLVSSFILVMRSCMLLLLEFVIGCFVLGKI